MCKKCGVVLVSDNWHVFAQKLKSYICKVCCLSRNQGYRKAKRAANPGLETELKRLWRKNNPGKAKAEARKSNSKPRTPAQREAQRTRSAKYRCDPVRREAARVRAAAYRLNNLGKYAAHFANYSAKKMHATVPWADKAIIASYYDAAHALTVITGEPWHVDHIIPLQGKTVSGFHHQDNLRVIRGADNIAKNNSFVSSDHELDLGS
jgi:hypothetical protein